MVADIVDLEAFRRRKARAAAKERRRGKVSKDGTAKPERAGQGTGTEGGERATSDDPGTDDDGRHGHEPA